MDPVYVSKTCPTKTVRCLKTNVEMVINEEDFDPRFHGDPESASKKIPKSSTPKPVIPRERIRSA